MASVMDVELPARYFFSEAVDFYHDFHGECEDCGRIVPECCCNVNMAFVGNFSAKTADFVVEDVATMNPAQFPFVRLTPDSFTHLAMDVRDNSVMYVPKYL